MWDSQSHKGRPIFGGWQKSSPNGSCGIGFTTFVKFKMEEAWNSIVRWGTVMVQVVVKTCQDSNNTNMLHIETTAHPHQRHQRLNAPSHALHWQALEAAKAAAFWVISETPSNHHSFFGIAYIIKWRKSEKEFLVVGQDRTSFNMGVFSDRPTVHEAFCQGNKVLELWNSLQRLYAQPRSWISPRRSRQIQLGTRVKLCQAQVLALRLRKVWA